MRPLVGKLVEVYREELELYRQVLAAASEEKEALAEDRPLSDIIKSLKHKRALMRAIESLDNSVLTEKEEFKNRRSSLDLTETQELYGLLESTRRIIEQIITVEKDSDKFILHSEGHGNGIRTTG
jgi:hypothetical protein